MSRRLLLSYLTLTVLVLAVLVIPLGVANQRDERQDLSAKVERDAVALASLAEDTLEGRRGIRPGALLRIAERYQADTGGRVVIVDDTGMALVDSSPPAPGARSFASRPEIEQALAGEVATGVRHSDTLGVDLVYVSVPVASSGVVHGAVRITYPLSAVQDRTLRYWLMLAAISAVVLCVVGLVGLRLARSISRPLAHVERAAASAGAGDLTARAPTGEGPPEVRSLALSFNDTVAKLDELVRSRQAFVADASHQLRTPLSALRLRLENLERDVTPDGREDLEASLAEVGRLSRLVDGLLQLARTDSATAAPEAVSVSRVAEERVETWSALAAEQHVSLVTAIEAPVGARATPGKLEQALDNLLENALEVSPRGATITVTVASAGGWAEIHVVDEGPGMTESERSLAFDRFWRGDGSAGGSGLGLAIVQRLVVSDGGTVELRTADGGGIDAVVRLPGEPAPSRARAYDASRG